MQKPEKETNDEIQECVSQMSSDVKFLTERVLAVEQALLSLLQEGEIEDIKVQHLHCSLLTQGENKAEEQGEH
jgi:hypothetical protein